MKIIKISKTIKESGIFGDAYDGIKGFFGRDPEKERRTEHQKTQDNEAAELKKRKTQERDRRGWKNDFADQLYFNDFSQHKNAIMDLKDLIQNEEPPNRDNLLREFNQKREDLKVWLGGKADSNSNLTRVQVLDAYGPSEYQFESDFINRILG